MGNKIAPTTPTTVTPAAVHLPRSWLLRDSAEMPADQASRKVVVTVESTRIKRFVQDNYGLPYLKVETDYSTTDIGQINTRVSALIEMI